MQYTAPTYNIDMEGGLCKQHPVHRKFENEFTVQSSHIRQCIVYVQRHNDQSYCCAQK